MYVERQTVAITTASDGSATVYSNNVTGRVLAVVLSISGLDNTADFTITAEATTEAILSLSNTNTNAVYYPRTAVHTTAGVAATFDGTHGILEPITLANDRVKIVVAQGGATKTGTVYVLIG